MPCLTLELILEKDHRFGFPRLKVRAADRSGRCAARGITPALMALTLNGCGLHSFYIQLPWAAPSALVSVAVAAEGAGHIGQVESSLSRLAFVLFKVLLTRCLHAL